MLRINWTFARRSLNSFFTLPDLYRNSIDQMKKKILTVHVNPDTFESGDVEKNVSSLGEQ